MRADGKVNRIVLVAQSRERRAVHGLVEPDVDAAGQDPVDLLLQALAG